jgi:subtilisin-like proprotein convertase family protein
MNDRCDSTHPTGSIPSVQPIRRHGCTRWMPLGCITGALLGVILHLLWFWGSPTYADNPTGLSPVADWVSGDADHTRSVAWGDVDGDGDLDLAVGNSGAYDGDCDCYLGEVNKVYLNEEGILQTTATWTSNDSDPTMSMAWGDVDGDGDLDLAVGNSGSANKLYLNQNGTLQRAYSWSDNITDTTTAIAWGDMDGNGTLDLVVGNDGNPSKVYLNQGGTLQTPADWESGDSNWTYSVALGDVDGDGDLDLAAGVGGNNEIYLNQGGSLQTSPAWISDDYDLTYDVAWGDVDGDGDLDLAVGNYFGTNKVYLNQGEGLPTAPSWQSDDSNNFTYSVAWADVNGDGNLDLAVGNEREWDTGCECYIKGENKVYLNQGSTLHTTLHTTPEIWAPNDGDDTCSVAWGDVDGDGDLDLAVGNRGTGNKVYLSTGKALRSDPTGVGSDYTSSVAWGDADGDGDLDLAFGFISSSAPNAVYLNEDGWFRNLTTWTPVYTDVTWSVAWGDVDGDGDLDLAVGNYGDPNRVYRNDGLDGLGDLQMSACWDSEDSDTTRSVAWGDVDGDGDLDLAVGNSGVYDSDRYLGEINRVYLNQDGNLQSSAAWTSDDSDPTMSVAWGDMDGDGDLDLGTGNWFAPNKVYLNQGGVLQTIPVWESAESDSTTSVAWGDVDGDGDLDLAAGNSGEYDAYAFYCYLGEVNKVYLNDGGILETTAAWISGDVDGTMSVALGDVDVDGDLDLAAGNYEGSNKVYLNEGGRLQTAAENPWISNDGDKTEAVAWGDMDGDGDLDLAAANSGYSELHIIYPNHGPTSPLYPDHATWMALDLSSNPVQTFSQAVTTLAPADFYAVPGIRHAMTIPITYTLFDPSGASARSVRGYYSPDGGGRWYTATAASGTITTDLTVGRVAPYSAYAGLPRSIPDPGTTNATLTIAESYKIADIDVWLDITHTQDDNLDVYLWSPQGTLVELFTDVGGDGDNFDHTVLSDQALMSIEYSTAPFTGTYRPEGSLADFNGEMTNGTWTLFVRDDLEVYTGTLNAWGLRITTEPPSHVYTWDVFNSGFFGQSDNVVFRLESYPVSSHTSPVGTYRYTHTVPGPYQRPYVAAQTFPFRVRGSQVRVMSGTVGSAAPISNAIVYRLPKDQLEGGFPLVDGNDVPFHTDIQGYLQGRGSIGISDTLLAMAPVHTALNYDGAVEFDGVDDWIETSDFDINDDFTISLWVNSDSITKRQAFIGKHDSDGNNLILFGFLFNGYYLNIRGTLFYDGIMTTGWQHLAVVGEEDGGTTTVTVYKNGEPLWQHEFNAVVGDVKGGKPWAIGQDWDPGSGGIQSDFFDGRIDEVRIWNTARSQADIQADMLRRLRGDETGLVAYWPFDDPLDTIALDHTANGYDGTLGGATWVGDFLGGYTVYYTNGAPTEDGLDAFHITRAGVQTLTVSAEHPLILFDVEVSLEWDASDDPVYLQQLEFDLQEASRSLYDFTDGQVALGNVTVYQNADEWAYSHVAVHVTNRLRPFAAQGGIVLTATVDPQHDDIIYGMGQVHMGATWNRYGTPGQNIGVDWPLILAHELGHYLLYLDDVYLGLDDNGLLIPVDTCTGSAMGDVYVPDNTEFIHDDIHWANNCADTLAARTLERDEWETIQLWYPWLVTPVVSNTGPSRMPFNFTTITILDPMTSTDTLVDPTFYLDYQDEAVSSSGARAFLLRNGDADPSDFEYVYDLGSPTGGQNRLLARGAQPGDRLCVFDRPWHQYGCEIIQAGDERLWMEKDETWTPVIQLSPVNSTTFGIQVADLPAGLTLKARLYPEFGSGFTETVLSYVSGSYSGTLDLAYPSMVGHVQVWVDEGMEPAETDPRPETIVAYTIGGNPGMQRGAGGMQRGAGGMQRGAGGMQRGAGGMQRGAGGMQRGAGAPVVSPDGQMIFFTENPIVFNEGEFYTVQTMADLPPLPPGRTLVGQGYSLVASPNITRVLTGSISIQYLGADVLAAAADESNLTMYFWNGNEWTALPTVLDTYYNLASTPSQGEGVYALMASVKIPLYGPGWNLVSYPVPGTRSVTEALRSISGTYAIVYGYVVTDTADPWRVHGVDAPAYVNRLHEMRFGQGYWISATETVTWYVGGTPGAVSASDVRNLQGPPATYYGPVLAGPGFTPATGTDVTAWVGGHLCGQGQTTQADDQVVYSIHVLADGPGGATGCGALGEVTMFRVGSQVMAPAAVWDDRQLWELPLQPGWRVFLPLVLRH